MTTFAIQDNGFVRNGRPHRVLSGALHYFRSHPAQWPRRLSVLRGMGLNTVETYVPWNLHEPTPGRYHDLDALTRFLDAAAAEGLDAIVRPGPYICAEWENGGLPWWLSGPLRCAHPDFLAAVDSWFDVLVPRIAARQTTRGGNVVMVQVENEYGSYGSDHTYLRHLRDGLMERGIDVPLFTSDGGEALFLTGGLVPDTLGTVNFGSDAAGQFAEFRRHRPRDPLFCMEFWDGWFDHWGDRHTTRSPEDAAAALDEVLAAGASVNLYMAHGGTNFGFWAGANAGGDVHDGAYRPTVTSYDYDAPMDEAGNPTPKYWVFREVIGKYAPLPAPPPPPPATLPAATVPLTRSVRLTDVFRTPTTHTPHVPSFEELNQHQGFLLHRTTLPGPRPPLPLRLRDLRDRAQLFVDGTEHAVFSRAADPTAVDHTDVPGGVTVELLVEAMGRINYGPLLGERKGILGGVLHERQYVHGWETTPIPLDTLPELPWDTGTSTHGPLFLGGTLTVTDPRDAYLDLTGWTKGVVWVNGFCLGRYWHIGPQRTLYVPEPVLHQGDNDITILELHPDASPRSVQVSPHPVLEGDPR
ncbi:glycoside hydrolase family 35 protein [Saccharothrix variisporea]|uniref:Beta-galactosidase n=1 Tax=Saccharothrix variisporea TaxID=543527 RepID=A0A495XID4_9PSEU|nr:glycoside hydrolase family 35 protein [Saccharothrix variisporea]RKT74251.1 beta-galactosidase [Saccharothrix variisporea]